MKGSEVMKLNEKLRFLRLKNKLTLKELGTISGVSLNSVYRWEHCHSIPRKRSLKKIADYYDVPLEWLRYDNVGKSYFDENGNCINPVLNTLAYENDMEQKLLKALIKLSDIDKHKVLTFIENMGAEKSDA